MKKIVTPETHPQDSVVGRYWKTRGVVYYCDSYDPAIGYWMTPVEGHPPTDLMGLSVNRTNVSERAIGRTYHAAGRPKNDRPDLNLEG